MSDPCALAGTEWIKPGKTTFPWRNDFVAPDVDFKPDLNTATMKYYIDFCAEHGIEYHSLDGYQDRAWYGGPIRPDGPTDITTAVLAIDLPEVLRYAKEKNVRIRELALHIFNAATHFHC
ncbi:MAG: glycoside hydrolase family 97 catalytic domain-containing protein [Aureliella sp.]